MGWRIGLAYNLRTSVTVGPGQPTDLGAELDTPDTVAAVRAALVAAGHLVVDLPDAPAVWDVLARQPVDLVFNMAEGTRGESREAQLPAVLEGLGIPYTGSGVLALAAALDKPTAKRLWQWHGVPTSPFVELPPGAALDLPPQLSFPLFAKPAHEGSSMGVSGDSVCRDREAFERQVRLIWEQYGQAALVEPFLPGREFTVGILGNGPHELLPIIEVDYSALTAAELDVNGTVYSRRFKAQWSDMVYYRLPAPLDGDRRRAIEALAVAAFTSLGCRDVGRVDVRLDGAGRPLVLEVNPLPGLTPGYSDLPRAAAAAGMDFPGLVAAIVTAAARRLGLA